MIRQMKDSGIPWVHEIPADWDIHPLYYYFAERNRPNRFGKENNLLSLSYGKIIKKDINTCEGLLPASYNSYNIIDTLDIVLRLTDLQNDKRSLRTGLAHERGIITSAYVTIKPVRQVVSAFFHYLLHAYDVKKVLYNMGNGVRQSLNYAELSKLPLIEPSIEEQQRIADYLDKKCAEIDTLSNSIQQQIDTLEQYKRAVITETVTKGLNPSAPMKDSGIPWIGQIPQHWEIKRLKRTVTLRNQKKQSSGETYIALEHVNSYTGTYSIEESITPEGTSNVMRKGDILFAKLRPYLAKAIIADLDGICSSEFLVLKEYQGISSFLLRILLSHWFINLVNSSTYGTKMPRANWEFIGNILIPLPPKSEQQAIADYLDDKCGKIDGIIQAKQQQLEILQQYKKAVIFEYVTGKKQL